METTMNSYKTPGEPPLKRATMMEDPRADQTLPTTRPTPARVKRLKLEADQHCLWAGKGSKVLLLIKFVHVAGNSRLRISKQYIHEHTLTSIIPTEARHISHE